MKKVITLFMVTVMIAVTLVGCGSNDDTVQSCIVSNISYATQDELESASQPDTLSANEQIYASIHFVESPKGMKYTVKWYLDGDEIKSETKVTVNDVQDVVVYELDAEHATTGTLKLDVIYKETVLFTKKLEIQ